MKDHYNDKIKDAASALERAIDKVDMLNQFEALRNDILTPVGLTLDDFIIPEKEEQAQHNLSENIAIYQEKIKFDFHRVDVLKASLHLTPTGENEYATSKHIQENLIGRYRTAKHVWNPNMLRLLGALQRDFENLDGHIIKKDF